MSGLLLTTKLYIPHPRATQRLVPRPHLMARLNEGLDARLTLISAPAGFGKTTLLSEWVPHSPCCVVWVSLDAGDNDPIRFWTYGIATLQLLQPHLGQAALALLQSPQTPALEPILTNLLNDITAFPDEFILVFDDYHVIENPALHDSLAYVLDHLPRNMHLTLTGRADPALPLARLRARRQLAEIRATDLRFTSEEAAAFLNEIMGLNLSAEDIAALETRTEGWIAGLQLAALSMQGRSDVASFINAFTGSHVYIMDYLAEEVLHRQPDNIQTFLLQTSILERLSGPLCDAVTGQADSQDVLEKLQRNNLFIIPLDDERHWYRYHHLFAEVLRARLQKATSAPAGAIAELHRRASAWYEQQGLSYGFVWITGLASLVSPAGGLFALILDFFLNLTAALLLSFGEEFGFRGYLLPRLMNLGVKRALLISGFLHGVWHLPIILLTPFYPTEGNLFMVIVLFLLTLTAAGGVYGYFRLISDSVWPSTLFHGAFNAFWDLFASVTIAVSPVAVQYLSGEAGLLTLLGTAVAAAYFIYRLQHRPEMSLSTPKPNVSI